MVQLGELMMILELHRQGLWVTAIARRIGRDPKTVRKYIERGVEAPAYGPRSVGRPSKLAPYMTFLRERVTAFPELTAARLTREIRQMGYAGAYTAVKRYLAAIRPESGPKPYEVRFETPPGFQAQVDFARFVVDFDDDPASRRIVWLFSLVLGHWGFLFAFTKLPASQWKSAPTTNAIERLHEEFKRRIKTQAVLPSAETAAMMFSAFAASRQICMRKVNGLKTLL